jgi:hypothetical protein
MVALSPEYQVILKRELETQYVPHLPTLLPNGNTPQQQADKQVSRALSAFVLQTMCGSNAKTSAKAVVDDFNDNGIDAIYYDSKHETLHLVQSKLKATEEFKQDEAHAFCAGIRLLIQKDFVTFNQNVKIRQTELEAALQTASIIKLWIAFTGSRVSDSAKTALLNLVNDEALGESERLSKTIGYFGPKEIADELLERNSYKPVNTQLLISHDCKVAEPRLTWYGMAKVADLVELHTDNPRALYEKNIRYFLGSGKSDVNKGIQKTLREDPASFFYLNNGVTALCSKVYAKDRTNGFRRLKIMGLSIINGAQTVASAAEVMASANPPDISEANVMFTLIEAAAEGNFGPRVTRARNSQNIVSTSNFASQDPQQERLRQELKGLGIEYHFRPEAAAAPTNTSILLDEAVWALAWLRPDPRYPVWLKSGKGDVNDPDSDAYKLLFTNEISGAHLANAVFFSRHMQVLIKHADAGASGIERLVYRHGMHAIGWTYLKRLKNRIHTASLVDPSVIPTLISQSFDVQRQIAVDTYANTTQIKGPLAYFKSQAETTPYLIDVMLQSYGLQNHAALPALQSAQGRENYPRERLFTFIAQSVPQV